MQLNYDLLLGEITTKYGSSSYPSARVALAYDCISYAQEWFNNPRGYPDLSNEGSSLSYLKKDLKRYVKKRVRLERYRRKYSFIPSFVWWFIARAVINWIVKRIIDHYLDQ